MKKLIIFTKPSGKYKIDDEALVASAHAKVFVETLGKARYLDKSIKSSQVKKTELAPKSNTKDKTLAKPKATPTVAPVPVPPRPIADKPIIPAAPPLPVVGRIADPDKSENVPKPFQRPSKDD